MMSRSDNRYEAALKVTGSAQFEAEVRVEGMLHATLVESAISCGELLSIDAAQASALRGFVALVSHLDAEALQTSPATGLIRSRAIHFAGQPAALVVAQTLQQARSAARAVRVTTQDRPAVTAMAQALDHAFAPASVGRFPAASNRGDVGRAMAEAHVIVHNRYETAVNNHHPMETHAVVCWWDGDKAVVHTSTQAIFATRASIAHAFAMPSEDVRVVSRFLGGGFGCKGQLWWPWMFWAMLASRKTGRPVRLELTRAQMFTLVGRRQETVQDMALGFDRTGHLTAIAHHVLAQTSTHADYSDSTAVYSRVFYACANVATSHRLVRTNEPQPIPMRAPGTAPGTFALESAFDEAAELLEIDPIDLRVRNFADHDQDAARRWSSNGLLECYRVGAERFGWSRRPVRGTTIDGRWRVGWGMAGTLYPAIRQACRVRAKFAPDASLLIQCGTQDMGSGTYTALGQMAAATLGVPLSQVTVELGDTRFPEGPFSGGSQVTASLMPAVEMAAERMRSMLAQAAIADENSPLFGRPIADIELRDGTIRSRTGNAAELLIEALTRFGNGGLQAEGESAATQLQSLSASSMGYGAVFAEVGVDPQLGEIRVRRVCGAFAAGRILNPLLARSQYVGGLIGGIGMALHEKTTTDVPSGRIIGDGFADYLIPVHADMPEFDIAMIEEDDPDLPGSVKGIGMLGTAGIQAAIANAVYDAGGPRIRQLPMRIENVLKGE